MASAAALLAALASLALLLHGGRLGLWPRPGSEATGGVRHRRYARLVLRTVVHFGLVALVLLAATGRLDAPVCLPGEFASLRALALATFGAPPWQALAGGLIGGVAVSAVLERRGYRIRVGKVGTLVPRCGGEQGWGVILAVVSGVTEELFFRLLLPLLIAQVSGSALLGFGVAALLFGHAHRYQGWPGMLATTAAGLLLTLAYLLSGALWVAMLVHVVVNINGLVLRPLR